MKAYGNLINRVQEEMKSATPEVGMGITEMCYSDRHAYTIIQVNPKGKRVLVQRDKATRADNRGMSDAQEWEYEPDPDALMIELKLNKHGNWKRAGDPNGNTFMIGKRDEHFDFSF